MQGVRDFLRWNFMKERFSEGLAILEHVLQSQHNVCKMSSAIVWVTFELDFLRREVFSAIACSRCAINEL